MKYVNSYVQKLQKGLKMPHHYNEHRYIKRKLMPSADNAKDDFDAMKKSSGEQLVKIDRTLERTESNYKKLHDDLGNIVKEEAKISSELKRKKAAVEQARAYHKRKRAQLSDSRDILHTAEVKLQKAVESQDTAVKVGIALSLIPLLGLLAGPITFIVAATTLQDAITEASRHTTVARKEVDLSKRAFEEAMSSEEKLRKELYQLDIRKKGTKQKLENLKQSIDQLKQDKKHIIEIDEKIKNCYRTLCSFHSTFKVLWGETNGGYSLSLLKNATQPVVKSVRSLLQCSSVNDLCGRTTLADLNHLYKEIKQVTSTAIRNRPEDEALLDLI